MFFAFSFRMLCEAVIHFQNNQEEVTLVVSSDKISFKNYLEEPGKKSYKISTSVVINLMYVLNHRQNVTKGKFLSRVELV